MVAIDSAPDLAGLPPISRIRRLPLDRRIGFLRRLKSDPDLAAQIPYLWRLWARPEQIPPSGAWFVWFILAGRGWGKTRTAAEFVREEVDAGRRGAWAFVSKDPGDAREVMIEGRSGILNVYPEGHPNRPRYVQTKRLIEWPNGARATVYSAEDPEALRGPEFDGGWADELAAWKYPRDTWDNLVLATRQPGPKGDSARVVVTTTPKPLEVVKELLDDEETTITGGSTYDNLENLDANFRRNVIRRYEGTRLGRQELHAEVLGEAEGALWNREILEATRVSDGLPDFKRIVVGVDPQAKKKRTRQFPSETGIVVAALGHDGHGYVLHDGSVNGKPDLWAKRVIAAYESHEADRVVAEVNNGGDMVEDVLRTRAPELPVKQVRAARGKDIRAEPIAALYEQGKIHHVGFFSDLEDQLCNWTGGAGEPSPDRLDALVWALTEIMLGRTVPDIDIDPDLGLASNPWEMR
jgi:phage terminase large subunit-like protein